MDIIRSGSQPSGRGPEEWFTGTVRIDPLFQLKEPARATGSAVTFEPGARTAWHTHPLGQVLIVTAGAGLVQREGGPIENIYPGDVIWFEPGEKHWHGATATSAMTHTAILEQLNGKGVEWMEKVSDDEYQNNNIKTMKAAIFQEPGKIEVVNVPDPKLQNPDEAIVRVMYSCICGSDLWFYRGLSPLEPGSRIGHEFMGIVEEVGENVTKVKPGDLVIAPFVASDGTCDLCLVGETRFCRNFRFWGSGGYDGGQGEKVRVPMANGTLFVIPKSDLDDHMMRALLPLSDVLATGHHAAVCAEVKSGSTVAVIGDGAVGLCAVAASKRLGASKIFLISTHPDRAAIGKQFGATEIVATRGEEAIEEVKRLTHGLGVDCALECVGTAESWQATFGVVRIGGNIGMVGVPHDVADISVAKLFSTNVGVKGSGASVAHYIPELMPDVLSGALDVSAIFTKTISLSQIAEGYKDMDDRKEIKVLIKM